MATDTAGLAGGKATWSSAFLLLQGPAPAYLAGGAACPGVTFVAQQVGKTVNAVGSQGRGGDFLFRWHWQCRLDVPSPLPKFPPELGSWVPSRTGCLHDARCFHCAPASPPRGADGPAELPALAVAAEIRNCRSGLLATACLGFPRKGAGQGAVSPEVEE